MGYGKDPFKQNKIKVKQSDYILVKIKKQLTERHQHS